MARPGRVNKENRRGEYFGVPKETKLNSPHPKKHWQDRIIRERDIYEERRTGPEDRREPGSDRRKVTLGEKVDDVKKKPAFRVTKKEHESMKIPPKRHRTEGDNAILKERRRKERRQ